MTTIADLNGHLNGHLNRHVDRPGAIVRRIAEVQLPTRWGDFICHAFQSTLDGSEHLALVRGAVRTAEVGADGPIGDAAAGAGAAGDDPLVRVHSECLTGDVFGSRRCDCGPQLDAAMQLIAEADRGVVVYLRGHEGRGIGLGHKLRAYELQEQGHDTVDANLALGLPVDSREYAIGAHILVELGVTKLRLLTNNPSKHVGLQGFGLEITDVVRIQSVPTEENIGYLRTKRERMGHLLDDLGEPGG